MPDTPIALRVPETCDACRRPGHVRLQQTVRGSQVVLEWHCVLCGEEWPARRREEEPVKGDEL